MKFADLELKFTADMSRLTKDLSGLKNNVDSLTKIVKVASAAFVALGAAMAVKSSFAALDAAAEKIDNLGKVAKQLEIPIEQLSVLRFAAGESGVEFETLSKMAAKASKNLAEMVSDGKSIMPIGRMNVKLTDSAGRLRSITDLLPEIATGLEQLDSAGARIDLASKIFGKEGGAEFVKFLADGGNFIKNMAEQTDRARRLGVIFSDDQVKKLTAYKDAVGRVEEAFLGLKVSVMTEVAPALTDVANELALQIGTVAPTISAASKALSLSVGGTPVQQAQAIKDLQVLKESFVELASTAMIEGGKAGGTAFLEVLKVGIVALWPVVFDQIRNHLSNVFSLTPLSGIFTPTPKAQLAELQAQRKPIDLAEVKYLEQEIASMKRAATEAGGFATDGFGVASQWMRISELQSRLDKILHVDREIKRLTAEMDEDFATRTMAIATASTEAVDATAAAYEQAKSRIAASLGAFNSAKETVMSRYVDAPGAATAAPTGSFPIMDLLNEIGDGWDGFTARMERTEPKLSKITDKLMERIAEIQDFRSDLSRRTAMVNAGMSGQDVDRLRLQNGFEDQVDSLIKKLGRDSQLVSELRAVQDLELQAFDADRIAKVNKETEQWVKSLRRTVDPASDTREQIELIVANYATGVIDFELYSKAMDFYSGKLNQVASVGEKFGDTMSDAIKGFSDDATRAFADFALDGKGSFQEVARAFERMLFETATKALLWQPLFNSLGGWFGGIFGSQTSAQPIGWQGPLQAGSAHGNVFDRGTPIAFANGGVVLSPVNFPMSGNRTGLMGEAGPEAIMPLERIGTDLGVRATGAGVTVQIIDQRGSGERAQVSESTGPDGRRMVQVLIRDSVKAAFSEGSMDTLMGRMYGLRRAGT